MTRILYGLFLSSAGLLSLLAAGCDDGPKIVDVKGTVTRNGKPVPNVALTFTPPVGRPSWGMADEQGNYKLRYSVSKDGAVVGPHKVTVEFPPATPQEENDLATGRKHLAGERREIMKKYGDPKNPAIDVEVKDDGKPIDIKLD